jgi:hypothetical protein
MERPWYTLRYDRMLFAVRLFLCNFCLHKSFEACHFLRHQLAALPIKWLTTDRTTGIQSPAEAKDLSSNLCVHASSEAHPSSCPAGTRDPFPEGKALPGHDANHSPHLVPRSRISRSSYSSPPRRLHGGSGIAFNSEMTSPKMMFPHGVEPAADNTLYPGAVPLSLSLSQIFSFILFSCEWN